MTSFCLQNVRTGSTLPPFPCGHALNFEKSEMFCTKKFGRPHMKNRFPLVQKMSELDKPPDCGRLFMDSPLV